MAEITLEMRDARVDADGVPALDGMSFKTTGARVLILGAARALFEAASGVVPVVRGEALVHGVRASDALRTRIVAGAPLDPPLPPSWSARTYIEWSARLAGHDRGASRRLATDAIERMRMGTIASGKLDKAAPHARRATVIAAAIATGARVVFLEDPLAQLTGETAQDLGRVIAQALADRAWAVFAPRIALESPLAAAADEALVVVGSQVVVQAAPAAIAARAHSYAVKVHGSAEALATLAEARGAKVVRDLATLTIDLDERLTTRDLLRMAQEASAVIIELRPLARAFA